MRYHRDDLVDMPTMIDKLDLHLYSRILQRPYGDEYYERIGLNKADLTKETRNFIGEQETVVGRGNKMKYEYKNIENLTKSGKPSFSFKTNVFEKYYATRVYFRGYDRFIIKIVANPTRFQRKSYMENGLIDEELDSKYEIHDTNYLYPQLLREKKSYEQFIIENRLHYPDINKIGEYITTKVLKAGDLGSYGFYLESLRDYTNLNAMHGDPEGRKELEAIFEGGMYRNCSCKYVEVNRDLEFPKADAREAMRGLVDFFCSRKGRDYYSSVGISSAKISDNREYDSIQIMLQLPNGYGRYKIYCKTNYTIRREICVYPHDFMNKFKSKKYGYIQGHFDEVFYKELVNPAFDMVDLKGIICNDICINSILPDLILKYIKVPDPEKNFWNKVYNGVLLNKEEIPKYLKKLVKCRWIYDNHSKRSKRMYELKPDLRVKYGLEHS